VVRHLSDKVGVMYLGKLVEEASVDTLFEHPLHPYTQALLSAIPVADLDKRSQRVVLEGDVPSPVNPPSGCPFHPRCRFRQDICTTVTPKLKRYSIDGRADHYAACHLIDAPEAPPEIQDTQVAAA
jgi:peptide/nickel transport system ATP-binding protein/oligopeptide transport system ATP-binding protein